MVPISTPPWGEFWLIYRPLGTTSLPYGIPAGAGSPDVHFINAFTDIAFKMRDKFKYL